MNTLKRCAAGVLSIVSLSVLTMAGCAVDPAPDAGDDEVSAVDDDGEAVDSAADALTYSYRIECVKKVNAFRATKGLAALARRTDKEACADAEAKKDFLSNIPHGAFGQCQESGQCECPNWGGATNQTIVNGCMQQMWNEGPGSDFSKHGHYTIMSNPSAKGVACGIYRSNGNVWALQNYF
jgi:hypothetical protein